MHVMMEHANLRCTTGLPREALPCSGALGNREGHEAGQETPGETDSSP